VVSTLSVSIWKCDYPEKRNCKAIDAEIAYAEGERKELYARLHG
jgi:hypothetical protein